MLPLTLFSYGFLAACAGLLFQILFLTPFGEEAKVMSPGLVFLFAAALVEEIAKLLFLIQAFRRFDEPIFRPLCLTLFGLGFAAVEVIFAFLVNPDGTPPPTLITTNILLHITTTLLLGFTLKRFTLTIPPIIGILGTVTLLHTLYNIFRLQG